MLVFPERVLDGDVPNRDFLHLYGPGSLWVLAAVFEVFGVSPRRRAGRRLPPAPRRRLRRATRCSAPGGRGSPAAAAPSPRSSSSRPIGLTALAWVGGVALRPVVRRSGLARRARPTRDRPGATACSPPPACSPAPPCSTGPTWSLAVGAGRAACCWPGSTGRAAAAGCWRGRRSASSPYLVHLAMAGPGNVVEGMFVEPVFELRGGRTLPLPPSWDDYDGFLQRAGLLDEPPWPLPRPAGPVQLNLWFCSLLVAGDRAAAVAGRRVPAAGGDRRLLAIAAFAAGLLPQALQRADSTHLAWVSCVPFAVLPGGGRRAGRAAAAVPPAVPGVAAVACRCVAHCSCSSRTSPSAPTATTSARRFGHRAATLRRSSTGAGSSTTGGPTPSPPSTRMLPVVDALTEPGDRLLVGTGDLAARPTARRSSTTCSPSSPPATRYIEMDPGVANAEDSGLADEVAAADVVILSSIRDDWNEPNDSLAASAPTSPTEVLAERVLPGRVRTARACSAAASTSCTDRCYAACTATADVGSAAVRTLVVMPDLRGGREHRGGPDRSVRAARPTSTCWWSTTAAPTAPPTSPREAAAELGADRRRGPGRKDGLGNAYRHGFRIGMDRGYDVLVQMDADLSHDPDGAPEPARRRSTGGADAVIGSRYVPGGSVPHWPWHRRCPVQVRQRATRAPCSACRSATPPPGFRAYRVDVLARHRRLLAPGPRATGSRSRRPTGSPAAGRHAHRGPDHLHRPGAGHSKMSLTVAAEELLLVTWWGFRDRVLRRARPRR